MKLVRRLLFLSFFFISSAFATCPEAPTSPYTCKGRVLISNMEELNSYLQDFGLNEKKGLIRRAHLTGSFLDTNPNSNLHLATPCGITILENTSIEVAGEVCLVSNESVIAKPSFTLKAQSALLKAPKKVIIRDNFTGVMAGDFSLISTGSTIDSRAHIRHTSNVQAGNLTLKALRRSTLGHTSVYTVPGKILVSSNGEDLPDDAELGVSEWSSIWRDTQISTSNLEITAVDKVRISRGVIVNAPAILLDGKSCRINKNSLLEGENKSGSCFSGLMPIAKFKLTPNKEANLGETISFDATKSYFNDGAKFVWSFYDVSETSGVENTLLESRVTETPLTNFSFNSLGKKLIKLRVESIEGYYAEANRKITIISPQPLPPVANLTATPLEGEVPLEITLDASGSTDADGSIVNHIFSDGTNVIESSSPTLTLIQETPGTFNYTVVVTDSQGLSDQSSVSVVAKPKTTEEESSLLSYYKFNLIPSGENFSLELQYEGRSFNGKTITEAYYSTPDGERLDVGRRVLGHIDALPFESTGPVDITLTIVDELGGTESFTQTIEPRREFQKPVLNFNSIEYSANQLVFFSNPIFDPYDQLDGIRSFEIDFGDGQIQNLEGNGFQTTHSYLESGPYDVTLKVFGENDLSFIETRTIQVTGIESSLEFPIADFAVERADWAPGVRLYVDQSLAPQSPILQYMWAFGDGTTGFGEEVIHFYEAGAYDVTLTVLLESGEQSVVKREVIIMNDAPNIASNVECTDIGNLTLECIMTGVDRLTDLTSLNIHFGDSEILPENIVSQSVSGQFAEITFTHTYQSAGNYSITYQVQTGRGEELVKNQDYSVTDAPGNLPPVADLFCSVIYKTVNCDALGSVDYDGFITNYEFSFGNGETVNNVDGQYFYTYPEIGTYTISLKITDNFGTTSETSQVVVIEEKPNEFPVPQLSCISNAPHKLSCDGRNSYDPDGQIVGGRLTSLETNDVLEVDNLSLLQKTFEFSSGGPKEIKIEVLDDQGAQVERISTFDVRENTPPTAVANCESTKIGEISCNGSESSDFDGQIASYTWTIAGVTYTGESITAANLVNSLETIQLTVTDDLGASATTSSEYAVLQNKAPVADFSCLSSSPWSISCTNLSSDPDNDALTYSWQIRDKSITSRDTGLIQFYEGDSIQVLLSISDGKEISQAQKTFILIENKPPTVEISQSIERGNPPYSLYLAAQAEDVDGGVSQVRWIINGESFEGATLTKEVKTEDVLNITVFVSDNLNVEVQKSIIHTPNKKILGSLDCNIVGTALECSTGGIYDPDGDIVDAQLFVNSIKTELNTNNVGIFENPIFGINLIEYRGTDNEGLASLISEEFFFENVNDPPLADFIYEINYQDELILDASASLSGGVIIESYNWSINGQNFITLTPVLTVPKPNLDQFNVVLTAIAKNGQTTEQTITVRNYSHSVRYPASISNTDIGGTDIDSDGVRDDFQYEMTNRVFGVSELYSPLVKIHKSLNTILNNPANLVIISENKQVILDQVKCIVGISENSDFAVEISKEAFSLTLNNKARLLRYLEINPGLSQLGTFDEEKFEEYKLKCD